MRDNLYKENLKIVGDNIRRVRQKNNMSQRDLAKKINVTNGNVSQFETGIRELGIMKILEISKYLNTTVDELTKGTK